MITFLHFQAMVASVVGKQRAKDVEEAERKERERRARRPSFEVEADEADVAQQERVRGLRKAFLLMDTDNSDSLDHHELLHAVKDAAMKDALVRVAPCLRGALQRPDAWFAHFMRLPVNLDEEGKDTGITFLDFVDFVDATEEERIKAFAARMLKHWTGSSAAPAWNRWRVLVKERKALRGKLDLLCRGIKRSKLWVGLHLWDEKARMVAEYEEGLRKYLEAHAEAMKEAEEGEEEGVEGEGEGGVEGEGEEEVDKIEERIKQSYGEEGVEAMG